MVSDDKIQDEIMQLKEEIRLMKSRKTKFSWAPFGVELVLGPSWTPIDEKKAKEILRNPKGRKKKK